MVYSRQVAKHAMKKRMMKMKYSHRATEITKENREKKYSHSPDIKRRGQEVAGEREFVSNEGEFLSD